MAVIEMSHTVIDPWTMMVYQEKVSLQIIRMYTYIPILSTHLCNTFELIRGYVLTERQTCYIVCSDGPLGAYISYTFDNNVAVL